MVDQTPEAGDPKKPGADEPGPDVPSTDWSGAPVEPTADTPAAPASSTPDLPPPASGAPPPIEGWAAAPAPPAAPPAAPPPFGWAAQPAPSTPPPAAGWGTTPTEAGAPPPPVGWAAMAAPPPTEVAPGLAFASTGRRFVAFLIDQIVLLLIGIVIAIIAVPLLGTGNVSSILVQVLSAAISLAYFVGTWRSAARATPGMRLLKLQVGNAFDGLTLTMDQGIRRWVALGAPLALLFATPATSGIGGLALLIWSVVLLITTATSPTKQGLHDRFANSAVVEPAGIGSGAVIGCVVLFVIVFVLLPLFSIIALVFVGGQVSSILSAVASPAP